MQMNQCLGIAAGGESMAPADQFPPEQLVVINLSVTNYPGRTILIPYRLMSRCEVDNTQPAHPDSARTVRQDAFVIRPAMHDLLAHGMHDGCIGGFRFQQIYRHSAHMAIRAHYDIRTRTLS